MRSPRIIGDLEQIYCTSHSSLLKFAVAIFEVLAAVDGNVRCQVLDVRLERMLAQHLRVAGICMVLLVSALMFASLTFLRPFL